MARKAWLPRYSRMMLLRPVTDEQVYFYFTTSLCMASLVYQMCMCMYIEQLFYDQFFFDKCNLFIYASQQFALAGFNRR